MSGVEGFAVGAPVSASTRVLIHADGPQQTTLCGLDKNRPTYGGYPIVTGDAFAVTCPACQIVRVPRVLPTFDEIRARHIRPAHRARLTLSGEIVVAAWVGGALLVVGAAIVLAVGVSS